MYNKFYRWILIFILFMIGTGLLVGMFNVMVDPFGVFGDRILNWFSYDMTNNPRVAKIAYLDKNHNLYDSYIIGSSKTSSYPTDKLDKYFNAKFYNMIMYGGDLYDIEKSTTYIVNHYKAKNIIINIGLEESVRFEEKSPSIKQDMHAKVEGSSLLTFYSKYFLLNPEYSIVKLREYVTRTYLPKQMNIFDPYTGVYNKIIRDREPIGSLSDFLDVYPDFNKPLAKSSMISMDKTVAAIKHIKELCDAKDINFMLIVSPIYYNELQIYQENQLKEYWGKLASVTDFWDFSGYTSISYEPRYFYDQYHFRNSVGEMALAYIFNDKSIYIAPGFGHHTTKENVSEYVRKIFNSSYNKPQPVEEYTSKVPILMYHCLDSDKRNENSTTVTPDQFREDMQVLKENGYNTISFSDIYNYVQYGKELPNKPILVSFDDGYESVYKYAYPILKEMGMKATTSIIGISVGKSMYKNTPKKMTPHFSYAAAREMYLSGVMDIQSHSYNMHEMNGFDVNPRDGVLQKKGESESKYISLFKNDYQKSKYEIEKNIGNQEFVYFYPFGKYSVLSEVLLREMGNKITVTTQLGINTIIKGMPQSLYDLKRINVGPDLTGKYLLEKINTYLKQ